MVEAAGVELDWGLRPLAHDSRVLARFRRCAVVPPNTLPLTPEMWPVIAGRSVEPTGRRREPEAAGTCPAASTGALPLVRIRGEAVEAAGTRARSVIS